jgi:hypothetical protein
MVANLAIWVNRPISNTYEHQTDLARWDAGIRVMGTHADQWPRPRRFDICTDHATFLHDVILGSKGTVDSRSCHESKDNDDDDDDDHHHDVINATAAVGFSHLGFRPSQS